MKVIDRKWNFVRVVCVNSWISHPVCYYCREQLETEEASIDGLEQKLDKVLKACSVMIESGKTYMSHRGWVFVLLSFLHVFFSCLNLPATWINIIYIRRIFLV